MIDRRTVLATGLTSLLAPVAFGSQPKKVGEYTIYAFDHKTHKNFIVEDATYEDFVKLYSEKSLEKLEQHKNGKYRKKATVIAQCDNFLLILVKKIDNIDNKYCEVYLDKKLIGITKRKDAWKLLIKYGCKKAYGDYMTALRFYADAYNRGALVANTKSIQISNFNIKEIV